VVGRGRRVGRHDDRGVAGKRPDVPRGPTAAAMTAVVNPTKARELALDRRVDVLEPVTDVPSDLRVHEHDGQVDEHVHVAHVVHPTDGAERVPQVTVDGEQGHVERDQHHRVTDQRLAGGRPEHGVHAVQVPLDVQQHGVPGRGTRDRQHAHHALERHLQHGDDGRRRVLYAQRPAHRGRPHVLGNGPSAAGQANGHHGQVERVPPDAERVVRLTRLRAADLFSAQGHRRDEQELPHSQQDRRTIVHDVSSDCITGAMLLL